MLAAQYGTTANLDTRISIHNRFSHNPYGWHRFMFDHFHFANSAVLELGCGNGKLWLENLHRLPKAGRLVLSDASAGMVETVREQLAAHLPHSTFAVIDAQAIPYPDAAFDIVIANHMLYHVPNRAAALREIRRVLKPGGLLYTATVGKHHLKELATLLKNYDAGINYGDKVTRPFTLENAPRQLERHVRVIAVNRYIDYLEINEAAPLVDYIMSLKGLNNIAEIIDETRLPDFTAYLDAIIQKKGFIRISKDTGVIVSYKG